MHSYHKMDTDDQHGVDDVSRYEKNVESDDIIDDLPRVVKRPRSPSPLGIDNIPSFNGAGDRWGKRRKWPVSAIFIHAGAGYHSIANETIHLEACNE